MVQLRAHLFSVSLLPLSTVWMAVSELAPQPVSFYAAVFFLVNATYILTDPGAHRALPRPHAAPVPPAAGARAAVAARSILRVDATIFFLDALVP